MFATERRQLIVSEVNRRGKLVTSDLAERLGVSEVTVRADLEDLERRGRLRRTRGGAVPADASAAADAFDMRMAIRSDAKREIALAAARFVDSDQTVIMDAGTTTFHLAQALPDVSNLTVYTPGLPLAHHLIGVEGVTVHLLGGRVDPAWQQTVGAPAAHGLAEVIAHTAFLGCSGVDADLDVVDSSRDVAELKHALVGHARTVVLLVDSSKLNRPGSTKVMPLTRVDTVITDAGITPTLRRALTRADIDVVIAEP